MQINNLILNNLFKITYLFLLIYFSYSFFVTGYTNYNKILKLSHNVESIVDKANSNEIVNLKAKKEINTESLFNIPYKISKFKTGIEKYEWIIKKSNFENKTKLDEENLIFEKTEVASIMNEMIGKNYNLEKVILTKEVPGFFINNMPQDMARINNTETRKKVFISLVLPLIADSNRNLSLKRDRVNNIYNKLKVFKTLSLNEHNWLTNLAIEYSIETKHVHKIKIAEDLLEHIDIIPNSIAIAQAAKESGWGTSRFAKEGNALFGQWTYDNNNGLLPFEREAGEQHLIRTFDNIKSSVEAYMENINSHKAYKKFREKRLEYRKNNIPIDSLTLVHELFPYAELPNYTEILHSIIKSNNLEFFDNVILVDEVSLV